MIHLSTKNLIIIILGVFIIGVGSGLILNNLKTQKVTADDLSLDDQEATIRAIKKVMPSVVSIIVYDYEEAISIDFSTGSQEVINNRVQKGSGTGFLISPDGLIITNKHVINTANDDTGEYRIILNNGKQYYAQFIGRDPIKDLAIIKIFDKNLPYVELSDSDNLEVGTTVIAIGNALGRYQNSVTKGIVSGLGRSLVASDGGGNFEVLDNVIQTDADINVGNSGGPLIDLTGKVVGVSVAIDSEGISIGFSIPINDARAVIKSVKEVGRIIRPRLGVRYIMITPEIAIDRKLNRDKGALLIESEKGDPAVLPDSPADEAGLLVGDIIFEINAIKIEGINTLFSVTQKYKPGDRIGLKIQRGDKVIIRVVQLDEFK